MVITLKAQARTKGENLAALRQSGLVPAVVYGRGKDALSISVSQGDFVKVFREAGESSTVTLELPSGKETVLIHEVVSDPVKGMPQHIDFLSIDINKPITVHIPLVFTGESQAVKSGLGSLVKVVHEVEVEGLPKDIPHELEVDLSVLTTIDSSIAISDLTLPKGVTATADESDLVAAIASLQEETEDSGPIDFDQIKVEERGKKEEEPLEN